MERSRLLLRGTVLAMESLPPSWAAKISWSVSSAAALVSFGAIVSVDTSLSPVASRGRTAQYGLSIGAQDGQVRALLAAQGCGFRRKAWGGAGYWPLR